MAKLRAAVIGLGVGERHAVGYQQHPAAELAVLCDTDPVKLAEVASRMPGVRTTTDPDAVLSDTGIDIVSIASYDSAHYRQVVAALEAGKHVLVEKPLCNAREQAEHIRTLLRQRPHLVLSARFPCRLIPRFTAVKELVAAGTFGTLYAVEGAYHYGKREKLTEGWRAREPHYSIVLGGGVHMVDLLLWLLQQPIVSVSAAGNHRALAGTAFVPNDYVTATVRFADGVIGDITCNFGTVHPHFHGLRLDGTAGTYINRREWGELYTVPDAAVLPQQITAPYPGDKGRLEHQHSFIDAVAGSGTPLVTADEIFATLAACFAIDEAVANGAAVAVRPL